MEGWHSAWVPQADSPRRRRGLPLTRLPSGCYCTSRSGGELLLLRLRGTLSTPAAAGWTRSTATSRGWSGGPTKATTPPALKTPGESFIRECRLYNPVLGAVRPSPLGSCWERSLGSCWGTARDWAPPSLSYPTCTGVPANRMLQIAGPLLIQYTVSHSASMTGTAIVGHLDDPVLLSAMVSKHICLFRFLCFCICCV